MVALTIMAMVAASSISITLFNQKRTLSDQYRLEAYRLAQSIAEHAMQVNYPTNFTPDFLMATNDPTSATQWTWTNTEKATLRSSGGDKGKAQFTYPSADGGVTFTKTIASRTVAGIGTARVLDITISWTFARRTQSITIPVVRGGN